MGRPVRNRYEVPKRQWGRWSNLARSVFNKVYSDMRPSTQLLYTHPDAAPMPLRHWETLRWNAAYIAADAVDA